MRRTIFILTVVTTASMLACGVAAAQVVTCPTGANGLCFGTDDNDTLNGTSSADDMRGLKGQDSLNAAAESDVLNGGRGNDTLRGEEGNDLLGGDLGKDIVNGGSEDDEYRFANGWGKDRLADDAAQGTFGERLTFSLVTRPVKMDLISNTSRPEVESGANTLNFGPNVEINSIDGGSSDDVIKGDDDIDSLNGIQGDDSIRGRAGVDDVMGMDGNDELFGGSGADFFEAGKGRDVIHAVDGEADSIDCGPGEDAVFFDQGTDALVNANACENQQP